MGAVNKVQDQNVVNRLSPLQRQILDVMRDRQAYRPRTEYIGNLPRTGQIIDALDRPRTPSSYASVSRALARLEKAGLVVSYLASMATQGKGRAYALPDEA